MRPIIQQPVVAEAQFLLLEKEFQMMEKEYEFCLAAKAPMKCELCDNLSFDVARVGIGFLIEVTTLHHSGHVFDEYETKKRNLICVECLVRHKHPTVQRWAQYHNLSYNVVHFEEALTNLKELRNNIIMCWECDLEFNHFDNATEIYTCPNNHQWTSARLIG